MLCALTVRKLESGSFDQFREAFMRDLPGGLPSGWVRFNMIRNVDDADEVVCFGFFDGSVAELRDDGQAGYDEQLAAIAPYVESVGANGVYEVVEDLAAAPDAAG